MNNGVISRNRLVFLMSGLLVLILNIGQASAQTDPVPPPSQEEKAKQPPVDSDEELRRSIQTAGGSEDLIIVNLEDYLK